MPGSAVIQGFWGVYAAVLPGMCSSQVYFSDMLNVAKILKSNGTDGGLLISSPVDFESLDFAEPVYLEFDGLQVPFFVQSCEARGSRYIIHLNDVTSLEDAEEIVGRELFADVSVEDDDEPDYTGWKVYDAGSEATFGHSAAPLYIGTVTGDEPIPGNYCIYVAMDGAGSGVSSGLGTPAGPGKEAGMPYTGHGSGGNAAMPGAAVREILIPLHADFVVSADPYARELVLDLPVGLY